MRVITLIVIILLSASIPAQLQTTGISAPASTGNHYNFTSLSPGTFPKSNGNFSFSLSGATTDFNASIVQGIGENGLGIRAEHSGSWSFFSAAMNSSATDRNISLVFSWNNRLNAGFTDSYIVFMNGGSALLNVSFGPSNGYRTKISYSGSSAYLGPEPSMNALWSISLYSPLNSSMAYLDVTNVSSPGLNVPVSLSLPGAVQPGIISVLAGGEICNLTLYSISDTPSHPSSVASINGRTAYHTSNTTLAYDVRGFAGFSGFPAMLEKINSLVYAGSTGNIYLLNYYNGSRKLLYANTDVNGTVWISDTAATGSVFCIIAHNTSFSLVDFNESTFTTTVSTENMTLPGRFMAVETGGNILVAGLHGNLFSFSPSDLSLIEAVNVSALAGRANTTLLDSYGNASGYYVQYYDSSNSTVFTASVDPVSLAVSGMEFSGMSPVDGSMNIISYSSDRARITAVVSYSPVKALSLLAEGRFTVIPAGGSITGFETAQSGEALIQDNNAYDVMTENGTFESTNLQYIEGQSIWFNGTSGVLVSGNLATTFNLAGYSAYSPDSITLAGNSSYYLSGDSQIRFSVSSALEYELSAAINNQTYNAQNADIMTVNSSALPDGSFGLRARAENTAGYISYFNSTAEVDNGYPYFTTSLQNVSFVSNTTRISYSVNWSVGIRTVSVDYLDSVFLLPSPGGSFTLNSGNYSGIFNISFTLTDAFGRVFHYNYTETAIWNNPSSLSLNIYNGEYFNESGVKVAWSSIRYVTGYKISVYGPQGEHSYSSLSGSCLVNLGNGNYTLKVMAELNDTSSLEIGEANFTVMLYDPGLRISHSSDSAYSFTGNSGNSSFFYSVKSNVTSTISAHLYSPSGELISDYSSYDSFNLSIGHRNSSLSMNGKYTVRISATGPSRLTNTSEYAFSVNNTLPANPVRNGSALYTDHPYAYLRSFRYADYSLHLERNGTERNYTGLSRNGSLTLYRGTGVYNFTLTVFSGSMNSNASEFSVFYFNSPPVISHSLQYSILANTSSENLKLGISDSVPESSVTITYGNSSTINATQDYTTGVLLKFSHDGNYTVHVHARDYCGNTNSTEFSLTVRYFPELKSADIGLLNLFIFQSLKAHLGGIKTSSFNITWEVNGIAERSGSSFLSSLPMGYDNVTLLVNNGNSTVSVHRSVLSTGPYVPLAAVALLIAMTAYRRNSGSSDEDAINEFLSGCDGLKVPAILKLSRKKKLKAGSVRSALERMAESGKAEFALDPDGEKYLRMKK